MGFLDRFVSTWLVSSKSRLHRCFAIVAFIGSGVISTYLFLLVSGLSFLQGASGYTLQVVISFAWVLIFPVWVFMFLAAMYLFDFIDRDR
jgi:hypothetical protein